MVAARMSRSAEVTVGAAGPVTSVEDVPARTADARRTTAALLALGRAGTGGSAQSLGFAGLVSGSAPDVGAYVARVLGPVLDYDRTRGTDLLGTLEAYFAAGGSPRHAATQLHVHANTVAQRLERIGSLLGTDWQRPRAVAGAPAGPAAPPPDARLTSPLPVPSCTGRTALPESGQLLSGFGRCGASGRGGGGQKTE